MSSRAEPRPRDTELRRQRRRSKSQSPRHRHSTISGERSGSQDRDREEEARTRDRYDHHTDSDRERYSRESDQGRVARNGRRGGGEEHSRNKDHYYGERRRRSVSPKPPTSSNNKALTVKTAGDPSGDGGWGKRSSTLPRPPDSPGRPSQSLSLVSREALPSQQSLVPGGRSPINGEVAPPVKRIEPNFAPSGALAAETNTLKGVVLKYNEPPEARKPIKSWRLYVFKGKEQVDLLHVHRQSAYLFGRDRVVSDVPIDHPSASKQHAVLQYRQVMEKNEFGDTKSLTKPFLIDLDSANGTIVNGDSIPASRYYELKTGDVLKFAFSTREYVLLVET